MLRLVIICAVTLVHASAAYPEKHWPPVSLSEVWAQPWVLVMALGAPGHLPLVMKAPEEGMAHRSVFYTTHPGDCHST